jgi:hypothetical protein
VGSDGASRAAFAKRVTRLLQHPEATAAFPGVLSNGTRQILIALPNDELGPIFKRVKNFGGPTNVAVVDEVALAVIVITPSTADEPFTTEDCDVSSKSEIGLLLSLLRSTGMPTRCRLREPDYEAELIENRVDVPA